VILFFFFINLPSLHSWRAYHQRSLILITVEAFENTFTLIKKIILNIPYLVLSPPKGRKHGTIQKNSATVWVLGIVT